MSKTILTYGTFDGFHYGHLEFLKRCKSYGGFLILGLSTDKLNKELNKKTYLNYNERFQTLEDIFLVDLIIPQKTLDQKKNDIEIHNVDILIMNSRWRGTLDHLHLPCEIKYFNEHYNIFNKKTKSKKRKRR